MLRKAAYHTRRIRLQKGSKLTLEKVQKVYEKNILKFGELTCNLCFKPIAFGEDSLEHFIPVSRVEEFPGIDLNDLNNLGVAHKKCNSSKRDLTLKEWFLNV